MDATKNFSSADLYDAHLETVQVVLPSLKSFGGKPRFFGPVSTVKCFEDNSRVKEAANEPGEGRVLVVDGGGSLRCALLGYQIAAKALANGWAGFVIFGCIRDRAIIAEMPLGVAALGSIPRKSTRRNEGQRDRPVEFLGARIEPGHFIYLDEDGALVSPQPIHV